MNEDHKHIGHKVTAMMDRMKITPLPRNFHLLYNAIFNADEELRGAVRGLQSNPSQADIDKVIARFIPEALGLDHLKKQQNDIISSITNTLISLGIENDELKTYMNVVDRVSNALNDEAQSGGVDPEKLKRMTSVLANASQTKMDATNKTMGDMDSNREELERVKNELKMMTTLANRDQLTGLPNRRSFDEKFNAIHDSGSKEKYSLILIDIDFFKKINDTYGHPGGDIVLKHVSHAIKSSMRADASVSRIGGEEFGVLVKTKDKEELRGLCERIRTTVESLEIKNKMSTSAVKVTISLGAGTVMISDTRDTLYKKVDACLYKSKEAGRNRTTLHQEPVAQAKATRKMYETEIRP